MICENRRCTRQAVYHAEARYLGTRQDSEHRHYCAECVSRLGRGIADIAAVFGGSPHDWMTVEYLGTDQCPVLHCDRPGSTQPDENGSGDSVCPTAISEHSERTTHNE